MWSSLLTQIYLWLFKFNSVEFPGRITRHQPIYPLCRQTTTASWFPHASSQTVPQSPVGALTYTKPSSPVRPLSNLTSAINSLQKFAVVTYLVRYKLMEDLRSHSSHSNDNLNGLETGHSKAGMNQKWTLWFKPAGAKNFNRRKGQHFHVGNIQV